MIEIGRLLVKSPVGARSGLQMQVCTNTRLLMTLRLQLLQREVTNIGPTSAFNGFPVNKPFSNLFSL